MALEAGDGFISGLVATNPVGATDPKSQGDDHIRLIKTALKGTFPNLSGAMNLTQGNLNALSPFFTDPNADRIAFWDDSAGAFAFLAPDGTSIAISGTTLQAGSNVPLKNAANTFATLQTIATSDDVEGLRIDAASGMLRTYGYLSSVSGGWIAARNGDDSAYGPLTLQALTLALTAASGITLNGVNVTDYARLSQANTFANSVTISHASSPALTITDTTTPTTFFAQVGDSVAAFGTSTNHPFSLYTNNTERYTISEAGAHDFKSGSVTTANDTADEVGYKGAPSRDVSSSTNTAATDAGKTIRFTGGSGQTFTLDSDPPEDSVVVLDNASGNAWTIAASSSLVFAGATGNRTLADGCMAAAIHRGSGVWAISGQLT